MPDTLELSVIIPTFNRVDILTETLSRLVAQETDGAFEVIIVDDGSTDATVATARSAAAHSPVPMTVIDAGAGGPAAARNRGMEAARGTTCLFMGDDTWPRPDLVDRHVRGHRQRPEAHVALLGLVIWAPASQPTPFMDWLNTGIQFDFGQITDPEDVRGSCFYTANVSAKTSFLTVNGGFDETFADAAFEDIELGLRLERAGMRLVYDAAAVVEHFHPIDLTGSLARMRRLGSAAGRLNHRAPDWPLPRRSGARHRLKAAILTPLNLLPGVLPLPARHATWHFLCHQAFREGCWGVQPRGSHPLRTGHVLARLATRDPSTRLSVK